MIVGKNLPQPSGDPFKPGKGSSNKRDKLSPNQLGPKKVSKRRLKRPPSPGGPIGFSISIITPEGSTIKKANKTALNMLGSWGGNLEKATSLLSTAAKKSCQGVASRAIETFTKHLDRAEDKIRESGAKGEAERENLDKARGTLSRLTETMGELGTDTPFKPQQVRSMISRKVLQLHSETCNLLRSLGIYKTELGSFQGGFEEDLDKALLAKDSKGGGLSVD